MNYLKINILFHVKYNFFKKTLIYNVNKATLFNISYNLEKTFFFETEKNHSF